MKVSHGLSSMIFLLVILAVCRPGRAAALDFSIRSLDFFPSGAKFVMEFTPNGDFELELPGAFDEDSVRLLTPLEAEDFKVIEKSRANWTPPSLAALKAEVDAQAVTVARLSAQKGALEQTLSMLGSIRPSKDALAKDILDYIKEAQSLKLTTENELADLSVKLGRETAKLSVLEDELEDLTPEDDETYLLVSGQARGRTLLLEAFTGAASWSPRYTMNMASETGAIETHMFATAMQHTGLDYSGAVTFHTKMPDESVSAPTLNPLRVGLRPKPKPEPARAGYANSMVREAAPRMMMEAGMALGDSVMEDMEAPRRKAPQRLSVASTLSDRTVTGEGTLSGNGIPTDFVLGEIRFSSKPELVLIPEQRSSAWLVASMDSNPMPLIPGRAQLLVDGSPAGETSLPEYGLSQSRIPFGYAPLITAKKEPLVEKTGASWFSGVFTGGYTLSITNGMAENRVITVRDRLPIPTHEKVTLDVKRISPEPRERDKENRLTWELPVKAGETVKIVVDYSLSYPSGEELQYR